jgi:SAM-dependent methyltransferase
MEYSKLENPPCEICGEGRSRRLFSAGKFSVIKCQNCGLVYTTPRPSEKEMMEHYAKEQRKIQPTEGPHGIKGVLQFMWYTYLRMMDREDLCLLKNVPPGRVLDIGCGFGDVLRELKNRGWEAHGIEINQIAAAQAKKFGLEIFVGQLSDARFPSKFFDAVILRHSLEHMYRPSEILKEVRRILKDNGVLLIEVPNVDSLEARIFKTRWALWNPPEHLYHFSRTTLELLLNKFKFCVSKVQYSPSPIGFLSSLDGMLRTNHKVENVVFSGFLYPFTSLISKVTPTYELRVLAKKS